MDPVEAEVAVVAAGVDLAAVEEADSKHRKTSSTHTESQQKADKIRHKHEKIQKNRSFGAYFCLFLERFSGFCKTAKA